MIARYSLRNVASYSPVHLITGAARKKKKGGGQFFSLNYRIATKKVSAGPISLY